MNFNLSQIANSVRTFATEKSPEILTGLGVAGVITTAVLATRATPKALYLLDEAENEKGDELTKIEVVKAAWKPYIPVVLSGAFSITCIIGANSVNAKRNAALAAAYKISETALLDYKSAVIETIGEKKEAKVRDKVAQKQIDRCNIDTTMLMLSNDEVLFLDGSSGRPFKSTMTKVEGAINIINNRLNNVDYVSLSELYDELGLSHTENSDYMGWNRLSDGLVELDPHPGVTDSGHPCLVLSYRVGPKYDFNSYC